MQRPARYFALAAVTIAVLAGCSKDEEPEPVVAAPVPPPVTIVKIGHAGPLTGSIAHLGKDDENGVRLALDQANAENPTIGGKKIKFELISEDDQADPKVGTTVAQKLVDAKVVGVLGHLNSGVTIPASEIYSKAGIPMISGAATNPKVTENGYKNVFRTVGRDDQQGPAIANYLVNEMKVKTVAIADDATSYGEGLANEVEKTLKAAGVKVVAHEKTTDKATDFKAILTKIKGKKPDAVFYGGMDATGGPLTKQARELGIKATFSFGDGGCTEEMGKLGGAATEGIICSQAGVPVKATSLAFQDAFKAKYGEAKIYAPFFYDGARILIAAMKKAGSTDPAKYLPEVAKISYDGASGHIEFDEKGDRKSAEITIFTMKAGKVEPIAIIKDGKSRKVEDVIAEIAAKAALVVPVGVSGVVAGSAPVAVPVVAASAPVAVPAPAATSAPAVAAKKEEMKK